MSGAAVPVIAVDFDGKICGYAFPACGPPNMLTIEVLRQLRAEGWKIIIHSSRVNSEWPEPGRREKVEAMVRYLLAHDVPFDEIWGVVFERFSSDEGTQGYEWWFEPNLTGKPVAHVYWDDRGLGDVDQGVPEEIVARCRQTYRRTQREYEESMAKTAKRKHAP
jgi:hypothetical protein